MLFLIKVSTKNKKTLKNFLTFITKLNIVQTNVKNISKKTLRKVVTILKSPHVNKSAQEQFEFRYYNKLLVIRSTQPLLFCVILKKIKDSNFLGLKLEVKGLLKSSATRLKNFNPDYVSVPTIDSKSITKYIQLFDIYGEFCLKQKNV